MITDISLCIFAVSLYFSVPIITALLMLDNFNPDVDHATFYFMWDKEE